MELQSLHQDQPGAAARIAATAEDARQLGFERVETRFEPHTGYHTVTAVPPSGQGEEDGR